MTASTAQRKAPWWLAVVLFSQVVLMSYSAKQADGEQNVIANWLMSPIYFAEKWGSRAISGVTGTVASYTALRGARAENEELREENAQLKGELNDARERAAELDLLRAHIALPAVPQYRKLAANVIARDSTTWFRRLTIDIGSAAGVKRNMPVITAGGIVGRIIDGGPNYSVVQVITDKQAGVGAMLQGSRAMGEVRGFDLWRCELKSISTNETVQPGEPVITTGLDRIYPKGLLIGTVESIDTDPNAPYDRIIVKPAAPIDRIEQVLVLLVEQKDLKIEEGK